jgi:hypothetical protein
LSRLKKVDRRTSDDVSKAPVPIIVRQEPIGESIKTSSAAMAAFSHRRRMTGSAAYEAILHNHLEFSVGFDLVYLMPITIIKIPPATIGRINSHRKPYQRELTIKLQSLIKFCPSSPRLVRLAAVC